MTSEELVNQNEYGHESPYILNIDKYSGPLDLLWELIKKSKIDITEISISEITEQYVAFLKLMEDMDIKIASSFILMASELIYYKSRALLPADEMKDEYFVQPLPPEFIQKLLEYKKFQKVSNELRDIFEIQNNVYIRNNIYENSENEELYLEVSLYELIKAFSNVLNSTEVIATQEILFDEILVSDKIEYITEMLKENEFIIFSQIFFGKAAKGEIIASFLAVLEMSKSGIIKVQQHRIFGDIRILRNFSLESFNS
ncbi:MAG: segregation/condensation protein A [Spirochaetes bacterium]|nr:segregation/condensation protein A [Spirochaetota bacterium]